MSSFKTRHHYVRSFAGRWFLFRGSMAIKDRVALKAATKIAAAIESAKLVNGYIHLGPCHLPESQNATAFPANAS
jgi:hypothetical protein